MPTLIGRADLLFKMQDWDERRQALPDHPRSTIATASDKADLRIYYRLGVVRKALGERKQALAMFDKALEIDPHHATR